MARDEQDVSESREPRARAQVDRATGQRRTNTVRYQGSRAAGPVGRSPRTATRIGRRLGSTSPDFFRIAEPHGPDSRRRPRRPRRLASLAGAHRGGARRLEPAAAGTARGWDTNRHACGVKDRSASGERRTLRVPHPGDDSSAAVPDCGASQTTNRPATRHQRRTHSDDAGRRPGPRHGNRADDGTPTQRRPPSEARLISMRCAGTVQAGDGGPTGRHPATEPARRGEAGAQLVRWVGRSR